MIGTLSQCSRFSDLRESFWCNPAAEALLQQTFSLEHSYYSSTGNGNLRLRIDEQDTILLHRSRSVQQQPSHYP